MYTYIHAYLEAREDFLPVEKEPGGPLVLVQQPARARHAQRRHQVSLWGFVRSLIGWLINRGWMVDWLND
jgi:hypothetical protein